MISFIKTQAVPKPHCFRMSLERRRGHLQNRKSEPLEVAKLAANFRSWIAANQDSECLCKSKHGGENYLEEISRAGIEMGSRAKRNHFRECPGGRHNLSW